MTLPLIVFVVFSCVTLALPWVISAPLSLVLFLQRPNKAYLVLVFLVLISYLSMLNASKLAESDLLFYKQYYEGSSDGNTSTLIFSIKEPVFFVINFIVRSLEVEFTTFIYFLTFAILSCFVYPFLSIGTRIHESNLVLFLLGVSYLFLPIIFIQIGHLTRQYLSAAFIVIYISQMLISKSRPIWLFLAIGTHFASVIFILIPIINRLRPRIFRTTHLGKLTAYFIAFGAVVLLIPIFARFLLQLPLGGYLAYIVTRLGQSEYYELREVSILITFLNVLIIISNHSAAKYLQPKFSNLREINLSNEQSKTYYFVIQALTIISFIPIIFQFFGHFEPAIRLFQFVLLTSGFSLLIVFAQKRFLRISLPLIGLMSILSFILYPNPWVYQLENIGLQFPLILLLGLSH